MKKKRKGWQAICLFVNKLVMILSKLNRFNAKKQQHTIQTLKGTSKKVESTLQRSLESLKNNKEIFFLLGKETINFSIFDLLLYK